MKKSSLKDGTKCRWLKTWLMSNPILQLDKIRQNVDNQKHDWC